jgi:hypothetical protein
MERPRIATFIEKYSESGWMGEQGNLIRIHLTAKGQIC